LTADEFLELLRVLILAPAVQRLWVVADRGMPVFPHSVDVALLCLDAYPEWSERFPGFRLDAVLVAAILHDLSKSSARLDGGRSHSQIMLQEPGVAVGEAMSVLEDVEAQVGVWFDSDGIDHIWHAIAAHHGKWGLVAPHTPEATLVHLCDNHSGTQHRIAPIDANDILPLLQQGYRWAQAGERLGVNRGIVKTRLDDACRAEGVRSSSELMERWRERGSVLVGNAERSRQIERARFIVDFARRCPDALIGEVRPHLKGFRTRKRPGSSERSKVGAR
jgi:hypothetical protein